MQLADLSMRNKAEKKQKRLKDKSKKGPRLYNASLGAQSDLSEFSYSSENDDLDLNNKSKQVIEIKHGL